jgi:epoxyqueuosine reductase QueG
MEVELAARAGIGWRGKHTLLLDRQGRGFFSGEIYCDLRSWKPISGRGPLRQLPKCIESARPRRSRRPTSLMRGAASPT